MFQLVLALAPLAPADVDALAAAPLFPVPTNTVTLADDDVPEDPFTGYLQGFFVSSEFVYLIIGGKGIWFHPDAVPEIPPYGVKITVHGLTPNDDGSYDASHITW